MTTDLASTESTKPVSRTGAVVIGRNEGDRLRPSLLSVKAVGIPFVYVDSGSRDGSVATADAIADLTVQLDPRSPFSAARARNTGLDALLQSFPECEFVLFLDGDCCLEKGFLAPAEKALAANAQLSVVTGHLRERHPEATTYNRLCALEWNSPVGRITNFAALGGIMLARVQHIQEEAGFNEALIAGEDSELGVRLALAGKVVEKIDVPMAVHDADIRAFSQWWARSVRAGHALAQRYAINGRSAVRDCRRELLSTLAWGVAVPLAILLLLPVTAGLSLVLLAIYLVLAARLYSHFRSRGEEIGNSLTFSGFGVLTKFANAWGVMHYCWSSARGRYRIIEYK